ncbi:hypothetical protein BMETH_550_3 [methanotrophic bacterial endosymbiont of Bathymodiolus sp.]|nr:hypothetical protein BMETH_550_3 [methanotrophic bacterial endosymbiont of Bathymodiolus sp.]
MLAGNFTLYIFNELLYILRRCATGIDNKVGMFSETSAPPIR